MVIRPQPGPQMELASSPADIAIIGGAAGVGKTFILLLDPSRYFSVPGWEGVIFRRESPQITAGGGLWDTSFELYPYMKGTPLQSPIHHWKFPPRAKLAFSHMQHEKHMRSHDGSQYAYIGFDQLESFTEKMFFYMLSRNRSMCGVKPCIRATCNPDPDSFLRHFLAWWIDQETGYPIMERSGTIRWMVRVAGEVHWADEPQELIDKFSTDDDDEVIPKSVTFIPGNVTDNKILMERDPGYRANLKALLDYERERLEKGNWFARPSAGELFKRKYFRIVEPEAVPYIHETVRYWDRAATAPSEENRNPDWTVGVKIGVDLDGNYYILDVFRGQMEPYDVKASMKSVTMVDGRDVRIGIEQDPGSAGKMEAYEYIKEFDGYDIEVYPKRSSKLSYWKPFAVQAKAGRVFMVRSPWNEAFLQEMESVTDGSQPGHDDQADSSSGAYLVLCGALGGGSGAAVDVNVY